MHQAGKRCPCESRRRIPEISLTPASRLACAPPLAKGSTAMRSDIIYLAMIVNKHDNGATLEQFMPSTLRKIRSFSLDPTVLSELERTKGSLSASERVNQLLKQGLEMERKANLDREAAIFFRSAPDDRNERRAFQKVNVRSWARK